MTQVLVAWDIPRYTQSDAEFIDSLPAKKVGVKVGLTTITAVNQAGGVIAHSILKRIQKAGGNGIYDGKFADISYQVQGAIENVVWRGVLGLTIRINDATERLLTEAVAARDRTYLRHQEHLDKGDALGPKPILFGVAVLSSEDADEAATLRYAERAAKAGFDGMVAPGKTLAAIRREFPHLKTLSIGIRAEFANWIANDDQRQTISHLEARDLGADMMAIGRMISMSSRPRETLGRILHELEHFT